LSTKLLWIGADLAVTDPHVRGALSAVEILAESSLAGGLARLKATDFGAIVLSLAALPCSGGRALEELQRVASGVPVIVHHGEGGIDDVISLTRQGAFYVLLGKLDAVALATVVANAARKSQVGLEESVANAPWRRFLIGRSRAMLQVCEIIELVAAKRCTILITGETGTGKEVVAKAVHAASNRAAASLVSVNCTALPATLIETEQHLNVCAAAVEVLAEVGTSAALPALRSCAARFAGTPFLPFAISIAISRISDTQG